MKRFIVTCLGVLLTAAVAYADKPTRSELSTTAVFPISCTGFDINLKYFVEFRFTFFYDKDGVLRTLHQYARGDVEISREGFPEKTLYGRRGDNQIIEFPDGNVTGGVINGGLVKIVLPGYGPLYFEAGHVEYDSNIDITSVAGIHNRVLEETDAICAYFH